MRIEKNIIMWELSLKCNLSCDFCYQTERRIKQEKQINLLDALKIIDNLPINSHIAFI
jgi:MoaA/NifB/PqqE/SkfB family radical SAM enzyme